MKKLLAPATGIALITALIGGCSLVPKLEAPPSSNSSNDARPSSSATPTAGACSAVYRQLLISTAASSGTSPTPLDDPVAAGYPQFVAAPDCSILWTNKHGLPSYGGVYANATDVGFDALLASAKAAGISTAAQPAPKGMSRFELLGEVSNGTTSSAGVILMLDATPAIGLSSPTIIFEWDRLLF